MRERYLDMRERREMRREEIAGEIERGRERLGREGEERELRVKQDGFSERE